MDLHLIYSDKGKFMKNNQNLMNAILDRKMLICIFNGFTAGLPLYFLVQMIPAWLRTEGIDLKTIGFFGFVLLPYSFKYLWAPVLDSYVPPFLGRRKGWMFITQILCFLFMISLAFVKPKESIDLVLYAGLAIAFFSASQDVVLDAYRRELLDDDELGLGNSIYANAYRVSGFIPGSLGLILSEYIDWSWVFIIISSFMFVGIIHSVIIRRVDGGVDSPKSFKEAVVDPFIEFFTRDGWKKGLLILLFIFFYKFGDTVATALITPFYLDVGFTAEQIGYVAKTVALWAMIFGGFVGGAIMFKIGINKSLWLFGVIQMVSIVGFAVLNEVGVNLIVFGVVIAFEYLGVGLGSAALMAFIAKSTNKKFTGTQLALLTSLFAIPKSFSGVLAGVIIEGISKDDGKFYEVFGNVQGLGYTNFFYICTALAIPGMLLLIWVAPLSKRD